MPKRTGFRQYQAARDGKEAVVKFIGNLMDDPDNMIKYLDKYELVDYINNHKDANVDGYGDRFLWTECLQRGDDYALHTFNERLSDFPELVDDKEFFMHAIRKQPEVLQFAGDKLKKDPEVVYSAYIQSCQNANNLEAGEHILKFADKSLQDNVWIKPYEIVKNITDASDDFKKKAKERAKEMFGSEKEDEVEVTSKEDAKPSFKQRLMEKLKKYDTEDDDGSSPDLQMEDV